MVLSEYSKVSLQVSVMISVDFAQAPKRIEHFGSEGGAPLLPSSVHTDS